MKSAGFSAVLMLAAALYSAPAHAQEVDVRDVSLMRQDFSDCWNSDVSGEDLSLVGGSISVERRPDGTTLVRLKVGAEPNTTYHFYLKCVRQLGDLTTGDDGFGNALFRFQTNEGGNIFAFDMYPEGAPLGNKFQSVQVDFLRPRPVVLSPRIEYVNQAGNRVSFEYEDMPAGSEVVVVNVASGTVVEGLSFLLTQGGDGSAEITVPSGATSYLLARGEADKKYIAQTIRFYGY